MTGIVGAVSDRNDRPAYVRFEYRQFEDRGESVKQGRAVMRDVEIAVVTAPYSKDEVEFEIAQWLSNMKQDVANQRLPQEWYEKYKQSYERWKEGQELPLDGTPLKGWGMLTPAQQQNLIGINVRTVEDLAAMNDEGIRRLGMGAVDLRNKARAWLADIKDHGASTQQIASLMADNAALKSTLEALQQQVMALRAQASKQEAPNFNPPSESMEITAADILPDTVAPQRQKTRAELYAEKFGKPPHHLMKPETIERRLKE